MASARGERELVVVAKPDVALRATATGLRSLAGADATPLNDVCSRYGGMMRPLFGVSEERLLMETASLAATPDVPNLSVYYRVDAPAERLQEIASALRGQPLVEAAYIQPRAEVPRMAVAPSAIPREAPSATPNFFSRQGYLEAAPSGIDARHAWSFPGGRGAGVRIIDIEGSWRFSHDDLIQNQGGVVGGVPTDSLGDRNHGAAVLGILGGDGKGVTGVSPDAIVSAISPNGPNMGMSAAIKMAAMRLQPGDIILLEQHCPGPRHNFQWRDDQAGYIPMEWFPANFEAIRFATRVRQVIVVAIAGNGGENLDDPLYDARPPDFPVGWINPFRRGDRDSDAILVGAGAPPPGTHGRDHGPDRSRLDYSNFGFAVDAQGWGREVTTCGYGDLQGGSNEDLWYTDQFNGTSAATPMIVGILACLQGIRRAWGLPPMSPRRARELLRTGGSFQQDAPGRPSTQRIGSRPDLRVLVGVLNSEALKLSKDSKDKEGSKDSKEKEALKDSKEKEVKEVKDNTKEAGAKDFKEKDKERKDGKDKDRPDQVKVPNELSPGSRGGNEKSISDRLESLAHTVAHLTHFISPELRPNLAANALAYEQRQADVQALSADLQRAVHEAKNAKDSKDTNDAKQHLEKLGDR